jgi:hypothetical protein
VKRRYSAAEQRERKTTPELLALWVQLEDQIAEADQTISKGVQEWSRFDETQQTQRSGKVWTNAAGAAQGHKRQWIKVQQHVTELLVERGINEAQVAAHYFDVCDKREREAMAAEAEGNASFDVVDGEVLVDAGAEAPAIPAEPAQPVTAPAARREPRAPAKPKRGRLWWVPVMAELARKYRS